MNILKKLKISEDKKFRILLIIAAILFVILIFVISNRTGRPRRQYVPPQETVTTAVPHTESGITKPKSTGKLANCKFGSCMNKVESPDKEYCEKHAHLEKTK